MERPLIGFIGQGWIGKNYADDFEKRGYDVVRYALEAPHNKNKEKVGTCDIVFIAVPTPTTPKGFDDSFLRAVLSLVGKGKIAVIKSTLVVGRTAELQRAFTHCTVLNSPEFLSEATAAHDAAHPDRNIIGMPEKTEVYSKAAKEVMAVLAKAPYELICSSEEAEFIKYSHNVNGYVQVVFSNMLYDIAQTHKMDWKILAEAFGADPMMSHRYLNPMHKNGRGAGGHCLIKDFEAFLELVRKDHKDDKVIRMLESIRDKNLELLLDSGKDLDLVEGVYGKEAISRRKRS